MFSTIYRFRRFLRRYWGLLSVGAVLTLASALFALAQPWPLKVIVDSVLQNKPVNLPGADLVEGRSKGFTLDVAIAAYLSILVLVAVTDYFGTFFMESTGERLVTDIRGALFARLQRHSLRFHATQRTGDLINRVMNDIDRIQEMLVEALSVLVPNVVLLAGMIVIMLLVDWPLTLMALAITPILFVAVFRYTRRIKGASRRARRREGLLAARTGEVLGAIRVVQAFTGEEAEDDRFSRDSTETLAANLEAVRLQAQFSPLVDVLAGVGMAVVLFVGTHQVLSGRLSLGLLLVFLSYISSLYKPMRQLSKLSWTTSRGVASAERVAEILDAELDVKDLPGARPAPRLNGEVKFEDVEFAYEQEPVLRDINVTVEPGQVVALVGPTGAGKSTLAGLIPRFFDPQRGRVLVNGIDVRELQLHSLRSQIALVLQEPLLFEGTLFENIAYGRPGATNKEIFRAAEIALVEEFATRLPRRYGTRIGERGMTLSGGERQRVSIARAILRDAPILILDEPTSGLDPTSEHLFMEALHRLIKERTTFVIAHRMSTIKGADLVLVLDRGRIIERGSHDELVRISGGIYRSFLELQVGQPLPSILQDESGPAAEDLPEPGRKSKRAVGR